MASLPSTSPPSLPHTPFVQLSPSWSPQHYRPSDGETEPTRSLASSVGSPGSISERRNPHYSLHTPTGQQVSPRSPHFYLPTMARLRSLEAGGLSSDTSDPSITPERLRVYSSPERYFASHLLAESTNTPPSTGVLNDLNNATESHRIVMVGGSIPNSPSRIPQPRQQAGTPRSIPRAAVQDENVRPS